MQGNSDQSFAKRGLLMIGRSVLTLGVAGLAGAAIMFGVAVLNDRAEAIPEPEAAAATPVRVQSATHQDSFRTLRQFVGQIEPGATVDLSFELGGLMTNLSVSEGDAVAGGQEIARLNTELLEAEKSRLQALKSATQAQLTFAQSRLDRADDLQQRGFTSIEARDEALARRDELFNRVAEIDATLRRLQINLSKSVIYAPFDGRIAAQSADAQETVSAGQTVVSVLQTSAPEFRVGLPLGLDTADLSTAEVRVGDITFPAELAQIRPDVDPVTRTRTALFRLPADDRLVFGQTAVLTLEITVRQRGIWVELDALQQGDGSVWTLLAVDQDSVVRRAEVEVIHAEEDRAYVAGSLQDGARLIAEGTHRVVPGQQVRVIAKAD